MVQDRKTPIVLKKPLTVATDEFSAAAYAAIPEKNIEDTGEIKKMFNVHKRVCTLKQGTVLWAETAYTREDGNDVAYVFLSSQSAHVVEKLQQGVEFDYQRPSTP